MPHPSRSARKSPVRASKVFVPTHVFHLSDGRSLRVRVGRTSASAKSGTLHAQTQESVKRGGAADAFYDAGRRRWVWKHDKGVTVDGIIPLEATKANHHGYPAEHAAGDPLGPYMPPMREWATKGPFRVWRNPLLDWTFKIPRQPKGSGVLEGFVEMPRVVAIGSHWIDGLEYVEQGTHLRVFHAPGMLALRELMESWYASLTLENLKVTAISRKYRVQPTRDWELPAFFTKPNAGRTTRAGGRATAHTTTAKGRKVEVVIGHDPGSDFRVVVHDPSVRGGPTMFRRDTLRGAEVEAALQADQAYTRGATRVVVLNHAHGIRPSVYVRKTMAAKLAKLIRAGNTTAVHGWTERLGGMPRGSRY